jgi:microcompartment protein CcmK/EutM
MRLVQPLSCEQVPNGDPLAVFDPIGADQGELVYYVLQYEATLAYPDRKLVPTDAAIIGLVDRVDDMSEQVLGGDDRGEAGA